MDRTVQTAWQARTPRTGRKRQGNSLSGQADGAAGLCRPAAACAVVKGGGMPGGGVRESEKRGFQVHGLTPHRTARQRFGIHSSGPPSGPAYAPPFSKELMISRTAVACLVNSTMTLLAICMAFAVSEESVFISSMVRLISSVAEDCSSVAVAMA